MERNIYEQITAEGALQTAVPQPVPSAGENAQHAEQQGVTPSIPCAGETAATPARERVLSSPSIPSAGETAAAGEAASTPGTVGQELTISPESSPYSPDNLILYHTSLGLFERLEKRGIITRDDYRQAVRILTEKYGFPPNSIFAEGA